MVYCIEGRFWQCPNAIVKFTDKRGQPSMRNLDQVDYVRSCSSLPPISLGHSIDSTLSSRHRLDLRHGVLKEPFPGSALDMVLLIFTITESQTHK